MNAQQTGFPISKWKSELSIRKDPLLTHLVSVETDILQYDSLRTCQALALLDEIAPSQNKRFQIRAQLMRAHINHLLRHCGETTTIGERLKKALVMAYELEDEVLILHIHLKLAGYYSLIQDHGNVVLYSRITNDIVNNSGMTHLVNAFFFYHYGYSLYHSHEYKECVKTLHRAIELGGKAMAEGDKEFGTYYLMHSWNTSGLAYQKLHQFDSAHYCFNQAIHYGTGDNFWVGLIKGNIGDIYFEKGNYDSAAVLLTLDIQESIKRGILDNAANSMQWMARIHSINGKHDLALQTLRQARQYLTRNPSDRYLANTLFAFAEVYKNTGNADSVYHYMKNYQQIHDGLEKASADNRAEIVQMRLDNTVGVQKILVLNKDKKRITLIRNFSLAIILLTMALGYIYLNRQRLKLQWNQKVAREAQKRAEIEVENAKQQLALFTENLRDKTRLVEDLQARLLHKELNEEQVNHIHELTSYTILTDDDWEHFRTLFNKVYPTFFIDLKRDVNDITTAELRMAALVRLQIPVKDAATMLGISINSAHKNRQRLRTRLGFADDAELEEYIVSRET